MKQKASPPAESEIPREDENLASEEKKREQQSWRSYQQLLSNHNLHNTSIPISELCLAEIFTQAEEKIARTELADYIVQSRELYVKQFVNERQSFLLRRTSKRKKQISKRRRAQLDKEQLVAARKEMHAQVERTKRRLKAMERRKGRRMPEAVLTRDSDTSANLIERMSNASRQYSRCIVKDGGGAVTTSPTSKKKLLHTAARQIQTMFRNWLARKYIDALKFLRDPYHLGIVLRRFEIEPGTLHMDNISNLLVELGIEEMGLGELQHFHFKLSSKFSQLISTDIFAKEYLEIASWEGRSSDQIRVVRCVRSLRYKESVLVHHKKSVLCEQTKPHQAAAAAAVVGGKEEVGEKNEDEEQEPGVCKDKCKSEGFQSAMSRGVCRPKSAPRERSAVVATLPSKKLSPIARPRPQSASVLQKRKRIVDQKSTSTHTPNFKSEMKPQTLGTNVKLFQERIRANKKLARQLEQSRVDLEIAARQLWKEKTKALSR